ncbi:uncharacterized protein A4U43_C08F14990 [Asparagus officinalis]|nr:uncharacterized protein A4U43_C08F14990 [Asparagus officinalis]
MCMLPRYELQIESERMASIERIIELWIEVVNFDIELLVTHIELAGATATTVLVAWCFEPLVIPAMAVLVTKCSEPLTTTTPVSSTSIDFSSILASCASYFMSGGEQLSMASIKSPLTIESLVMATEVGSSGLVGGPSSLDSKNSAKSEIQILVESLMKLFNQIVESTIAGA